MQQRAQSPVPAVLTIVAVAAAIVVAFIGSGALGGTPISEAAGGALAEDSTPLAPAGPAFSIWSVIYVGLVLYAVYQVLPVARRSARQGRLRLWAAVSAALNAAWIWMVQLGSVAASVAVIIVLLAVLIRVMMVLLADRPANIVEAVVTDGTFGLYLGWVCVATVANITAWGVTLGVEATFPGFEWAAVAVIVVTLLIGLGTAWWTRGRLTPAAATAWGLAWIAVGRMTTDLESATVAWAAGIAASVLVVGAVGLRLTRARREHPATSSPARSG
ncbi:MAG: tryptophan-rich sensory protein [Propionibacterium sp.]|nr:tryptophan-rich sensory protein [Propionibacterium sp.]